MFLIYQLPAAPANDNSYFLPLIELCLSSFSLKVLRSSVKLCLSSGLLTLDSRPPLTGYSQSMSTPSKSYFIMKSITLSANVFLDSCVNATSENLPDQDHPPTDIMVFRLGFLVFN